MEYTLIQPKIPLKLNTVERILTNRGIGLAEVKHYLNTTNEDINSPLLLDNMEKGVKMLFSHIINNDNCYICVDCDADGYTSSALLMNYLYRLFPNYVLNHLAYSLHDGKQHGIELDKVPKGTKLVIIPDAGSSQYEEHKQLAAAGIDVLVLDHHESDKISEDACIINNQLCDYPSKALSGVGIVWKFCSYIDTLLDITEAENYIDLAAVGIISDMMDLRDFEVRRIITLGLNHIRNPFLDEIIRVQNYSISKHGGLDPFAVSFYITPMINATIRVGTMAEKEVLFKSMLDYEAYKQVPSTKRGAKGQKEMLVIQACRNCNNIKNRQQKLRDSNLDTIYHIIDSNDLNKNKVLIIPLEEKVDSSLTGLVANQLMAKYQKPVLLLNKIFDDDGNLIWSGSGRNCSNSPIDSFRELVLNSGLSTLAQGRVWPLNFFPFISGVI